MKLKSDYVLREIADEYLVVPLCEEADRINGILKLSESGALLWKLLESEQSEESLTAALTEQYTVEEAQARGCVRDFLASLAAIGCLD